MVSTDEYDFKPRWRWARTRFERKNGIQKVIKSGWQSEPTQGNKHPTKPIELAAITEKDNERMNGYNCVQLEAFNTYMFRVETKAHSKWAYIASIVA